MQRISVPANGSIKVQGIIRGYKHNVYAVTIGAGETLTVTFETQSTSAYFNLIDAADASGAAIHRGDVAGKVAKVTAVAPKTYLVQPYIVRAAARRDSTARYAFTIARQSRASSIGTPAATTVANASVRPSFDCAKAGNAATKLICTDPLLVALDVETTRLYGLAIEGKYMTPDRRRELVATERGWIKGRDECWKADNLRTCILASYASRIHELRQGYSDARTQDDKGNSTGPFVLACRNFNALIGVTFVRTDPPVAQLSWLNTAATLVLAPSGSGARYDRVTGPASMLWTRGSTARVKIDGQPELECKVETPG